MIKRRIYDYIATDGTRLFTLFDTGARNSYITRSAVRNLGMNKETIMKIGKVFILVIVILPLVYYFLAAQDNKKAMLTITIVDELTNKPVEGVSISIIEFPPTRGLSSFEDAIVKKSNNIGKVIFDALKAGKYLIAVAEVPDASRFAIETIPFLEINKDTSYEIKLPPTAAISGKVILIKPEKFTKVIVTAVQHKGNFIVIKKEAEVGKDGTYKIVGLNGLLSVDIGVRSTVSHAKLIKGAKLTQYKETKDVNFEIMAIDESVMSITGTVMVDGNPAPVTGILAFSTSPINGFIISTSSSVIDGKFTMFDLPPGEYKVKVNNASGKGRVPQDYPEKEVTVEEGKTATVDFNVSSK